MEQTVYEIILYLIEAIISGVFMVHMLRPKHQILLQLFIWCEVVILAMLFTTPFSFLRILIIAVLELITTFLLFKNQTYKKLFAFVYMEVLLLISSLLAYATYYLIIDQTATYLTVCRSDSCAYCLLYVLYFSVLTSVLSQCSKPRWGIELPWVIGTQIVLGVGEVFAILSVARVTSGMIVLSESWMVITTVVFMVAANLSIGMLAPYLLRLVSQATGIDYGRELSSMEYKYYEMSVANDKKLMAIKHDISNHIQVIYSMFHNGENQRGFELINELRDHYAHVEQIVYCGNPVINIILSTKKSKAEENGIETHIRVKEDLNNVPISDFDLSTIICNLLDNAIRGCLCSEQTNPRLIIEFTTKNQYLVIRVLNTCRMSMYVENTDKIETTKTNTQTRGFGMPLIAGIAKKYRGDFVVSAQNGIFTATTILSIKQK